MPDNPYAEWATAPPAAPPSAAGSANPYAEWATPGAAAPPRGRVLGAAAAPAPRETWAQGALMAPGRFARGAARGLAGDVYGAAQLVGAGDAFPQGFADFALGHRTGSDVWDPSGAWSETAGDIAGGAAPFMMIPGGAVARGATALGRMARAAGIGAAAGAIQPTEAGRSHIPGAVIGAATGGTLSGLGSRLFSQRAFQDFNQGIYRALVGPLANYGVQVPERIGRAGLNDLAGQLRALFYHPPGHPVGDAARDALDRLNELSRTTHEGYFTPQRVRAFFDRESGRQAAGGADPFLDNAFTRLADDAIRKGVPELYAQGGGGLTSVAARAAGHVVGHGAHAVGIPVPPFVSGEAAAAAARPAARSTVGSLGPIASNPSAVRAAATQTAEEATGRRNRGPLRVTVGRPDAATIRLSDETRREVATERGAGP